MCLSIIPYVKKNGAAGGRTATAVRVLAMLLIACGCSHLHKPPTTLTATFPENLGAVLIESKNDTNYVMTKDSLIIAVPKQYEINLRGDVEK